MPRGATGVLARARRIDRPWVLSSAIELRVRAVHNEAGIRLRTSVMVETLEAIAAEAPRVVVVVSEVAVEVSEEVVVDADKRRGYSYPRR